MLGIINLIGPALLLAAAWLLCVMWWRRRRQARFSSRQRVGDVIGAARRGDARSVPSYRSPQSRPPAPVDDEDTAPVSLVLLLNEPRFLDEYVLDRLARRALRLDDVDGLDNNSPNNNSPNNDSLNSGRLVIGDSPTFLVCGNRFTFLVNNYAEPYVENLDAVGDEIEDVRLRKAVRSHRAWISVDLVSVEFVGREDAEPDDPNEFGGATGGEMFAEEADSRMYGTVSRKESTDIHPAELDEAYGWMGRLIAELADSDCVAIFSPATDQMNVYDETLEEGLRSKHPLDVFVEPTFLPVVEIDEQAASVQMAIAEAQRRWPEFERAFGRRTGEQLFAVKAPFCRRRRQRVHVACRNGGSRTT